jgi:hypothetical protein
MIQYLNSLTSAQLGLFTLVIATATVIIAIGLIIAIKAIWLSTFPKHNWSEITTLTATIANRVNPDGTHPSFPIQGRICLKCGKSIEGSLLSKYEETYYRTRYKCNK